MTGINNVVAGIIMSVDNTGWQERTLLVLAYVQKCWVLKLPQNLSYHPPVLSELKKKFGLI